MFVQCAKFVERHHESASRKLSVFGAEKTEDTVPLAAKMNLALHGLSGDIRQANSYYEDPHRVVGAFDFVIANPPFNVDKIKKDYDEIRARTSAEYSAAGAAFPEG